MARWALVDIDERKMTKSGPMFHDARLAGSTIVLKFNEAGAGLRIRHGDKLDEFAIAGADHKWYWANARIVDKNAVEVRSASVARPLAVRYAFYNNPRHNSAFALPAVRTTSAVGCAQSGVGNRRCVIAQTRFSRHADCC